MAGDSRYITSRFRARCYVCQNYYDQGEQIWYEPPHNGRSSRGCHTRCRVAANGVSGPQEYVFANRDATSLFDRLVYDKPEDMLKRAFECSAEQNEPCSVARMENGKLTPMFMISVVPGISLLPAPPEPEVDKPHEGPLFEWPAGAKPPY